MSFTDDDLKRLHAEYDEMGSDKIDALIVRLKTAESICEYEQTGIHKRDKHGGGCSVCLLLAAWRKAAGKS